MEFNDKLGRFVWAGGYLVLIVMIVSMSYCNIRNNESNNAQIAARHSSVAQMVNSGIDPKAAGCAIAITNPGISTETKLFCNK